MCVMCDPYYSCSSQAIRRERQALSLSSPFGLAQASWRVARNTLV
jgi:hypothetical protein